MVISTQFRSFVILLTWFVSSFFLLQPAQALEVTAFKQAVAEAASSDEDIAAFYRSSGYDSLWTGASTRERKRRAVFLKALSQADIHGLPASRYDVEGLKAQMKAARTQRELGRVEVALSKTFLMYARDLQTGVLIPAKVDRAIKRQVPYRDRKSYLVNFSKSSPGGFFKALAPKTTEYSALLKEKLRMERLIAKGGWGAQVSAKSLKPGESGQPVVALRNRLIAMKFLRRTNSQVYDNAMQSAVQKFQAAHGMDADGVAGADTIKEINKSVETRLQSVIVAMERERWVNQDRGKRHILVNIPDFTAKVIDDGKVTFETRSVVGANKSDRPTPEFSDVMEHMVINPSWYVPRSIIAKEYLPKLQRNPNAHRYMEITDNRGRRVDRSRVNFAAYNSRNFPFAMRQPPSQRNALGLVKFMFPNVHNIYLHDTPAKNLFGREVRAFSHGCIRLADPFDFAYTLLAAQSDDPKDTFQSILATGRETKVDLVDPVPVHLIYRTAFTTAKGKTEFRRDIYGRDAKIWDALNRAGVALRAVQG
ncbi:MAG: L,D-transpeptidase family protein [Pseudomonadota bacterium]